jgi:2-(1,2-epoxy-1,2-dihydrophenyl)acetyl-CoA isomerase
MTDEPMIVVTRAGAVATVRLDDPGSLNALSVEMANQLRAALSDLAHDPSIRALVLTGTGRGFCAGGDVQSFYDNREDPADVMAEVIDGLHGAIEVLIDLPFPTVAAINGVVAGAGMGLAMATDLAIAVDDAIFTMAYTGIGVSPDGSSTYFLPRLVGTRVAMEMILTNRRVNAEEAVTLGLINRAVPADAFESEVAAMGEKLARGPTHAYVRSRHLLRSSLTNDPIAQMAAEGRGIMAAGETKDFYEGVSAFIEKRRPTFTGE